MIIFVLIISVVIIGFLLFFLYYYKHKYDVCEQSRHAQAEIDEAAVIRPRDGLGQPVDWFVVFKLPNKSKNCADSTQSCADTCACDGCSKPASCDYWNSGSSASGDRSTGQCYYYADSNNSTLQYYTDLGFGCLSDDKSPLQQTIAQLKQGKWATWNDQGVNSSCEAPHAHSKGAVCYNSGGGFLLNTSSPHWPNTDLQAMGCQQTNNVEYAQHVFCFSASAADLDSWLAAATDASLCITESSFLPNKPLAGGATPAPLTIHTIAGTPIVIMMKGSNDYYQPWSLVAETLGVGLSVASWTSAASGGTSGWGDAPRYNSSTQPLKQILDIATPHGCFRSVYSYSHSKWAIGDSGNWCVFGAMNAQNSQAHRGGGFYALQNAALWQSLRAFVANTMDR